MGPPSDGLPPPRSAYFIELNQSNENTPCDGVVTGVYLSTVLAHQIVWVCSNINL